MLARVPPVLIALAVAVLVLGGAVVLGLTLGSRPLAPCASSSSSSSPSSPSASAAPACATPAVTPTVTPTG